MKGRQCRCIDCETADARHQVQVPLHRLIDRRHEGVESLGIAVRLGTVVGFDEHVGTAQHLHRDQRDLDGLGSGAQHLQAVRFEFTGQRLGDLARDGGGREEFEDGHGLDVR